MLMAKYLRAGHPFEKQDTTSKTTIFLGVDSFSPFFSGFPKVFYLRHPTCPFLGTQKKRSNYKFLLEPPKNARPPQNARPNPPSFIQRKASIATFFNMCTRLRIFALVLWTDSCARFALRFPLAPFEHSATDHLGGPISPVFGKTLEAGEKVHVYHILVTTPGFANAFGLRAEI